MEFFGLESVLVSINLRVELLSSILRVEKRVWCGGVRVGGECGRVKACNRWLGSC